MEQESTSKKEIQKKPKENPEPTINFNIWDHCTQTFLSQELSTLYIILND